MVGRKRDADGINYPFTFEKSNLNKKLELNIDFDADIKNGFNIIVLAHQPGIGKTYNAKEYMEKHPNSFYFTDRHSAIDEHTSEWEENGIEYHHWEGFERICSDETVKLLCKKHHLQPDDIINRYDWTDAKNNISEYNQQFKDRVRIFAPFNYLKSQSFFSKLPDVVFIDERINQLDEYHFNADKIVNGFNLIKVPEEYIDFIKAKKLYLFLEEDIRDKIKSHYAETVINAIMKKDNELRDELKDFNPYDLFGYSYWGRIYNYGYDSYAVPFYYYAFNVVAQGKPIVILDASFNINLFHYFLESYNGEIKRIHLPGFSKINANVKIYYSQHQNPESKIYRMRPKGSWSKNSIIRGWEAEKEWISRDMQHIMEVFGEGNVGVITFRELAEKGHMLGFDLEYFGGLRGTNKLENKPVLVIIGGWFPPIPSWNIPKENKKECQETLDNLVWKYFLKTITKDDCKDAYAGAPLEVEKSYELLSKGIAHLTIDKNHTKKEKPADIADANPIGTINTIFFDEMYQAFHRNRGLRYPRIIFSYGWFPEPEAVYHFRNASESGERRVEHFINYKLRWEFEDNIEKIHNEYIEERDYRNGLKFFEWLGTQYSQGKVLQILREFEKGKRCKSPSKIANLYKIWEGSGEGVDNKLVKHFKLLYEEMKEKGKVKTKSKKK